MKLWLKILLPFVVLLLGAGAAKTLFDSRELPVAQPPEIPVPIVTTLEARRTRHAVQVESRGTVVPRTESQLVVEVSGRVLWVSPQLVSGGFFEAGDELLRIDPRDFELARAQAELEVARSSRRLAEEEADAEVARKEWERLGQGEPTPLSLRQPQVAEARAALTSAEALLERAERDLARTTLAAPFPGRVRQESVDVGQYVRLGEAVATVYGTEVAEVRLPLPDGELEFLSLPFAAAGSEERRPAVELSAEFAGEGRSWTAHVVRTEGEIDPTTRMVMAVAQVEDPYGREAEEPGVPLALGMFVEGRIQGHVLEDVFVLPRTALRDDEMVYVLDADDRLHFVAAEVVRREREQVILRAEIPDGTRVVVSPIEVVTDGMRVRDLANDVSPRGAGSEAAAASDAVRDGAEDAR